MIFHILVMATKLLNITWKIQMEGIQEDIRMVLAQEIGPIVLLATELADANIAEARDKMNILGMGGAVYAEVRGVALDVMGKEGIITKI